MRFRLIALIALVLGLSRLAFPAEVGSVRHGRATTHKAARHSKTRARSIRRIPAPLKQEATPLIAPPSMQLAMAPLVPETPAAISQLMPHRERKLPAVTEVAVVRPGDVKPLRPAYWTAERAAGLETTHRDNLPRLTTNPPVTLATVGASYLAFPHQPAFKISIRI